MTKIEYIAKLNTAFKVVSNTIKEFDLVPEMTNNGEIKAYEALVYRENGTGALVGQEMPFYVIHEGEADESVMPIGKIIENKPYNDFKDQVRTYLDNIISQSTTIKKIVIDLLNEDNEFAEVTAYIETDSIVSKTRFFLTKDDQGVAYHRELA